MGDRQRNWLTAMVLLVSVAASVVAIQHLTPARAARAQSVEGQPFTVRIVCGLTDSRPTGWTGSLRATSANIERLEGWRFMPNEDQITSPAAWQLRTDATVTGPNQPAANPPITPNGVLVFGTARDDASFRVTTNFGNFSFRLSELKLGEPRPQLNGAASVELLPATNKLTDDANEDDFPSIAADSDGTAWAAWQSYSGRRDEIRLRKFEGGRWHTFTRVPGTSGDVWRPQVVIDANHYVWVVWSQQVNAHSTSSGQGNWDLYARAFDGYQWLEEHRLTTNPLPDINPHAIADHAGNLVVVWQGYRTYTSETRGPKSQNPKPAVRPQSDIFLKHYDHYLRKWSDDLEVSQTVANDWDPAVAVDSKNNTWVVWDSYAFGNYDVNLRKISLSPNGKFTGDPIIHVTSTPQAEMRATVACDRQDRVWIAYEVASANWGKDQGYTVRANPVGVPLGGQRQVAVRVIVDGKIQAPVTQPSSAMPAGERNFFFTPHLITDDAGRMWLNVRHRSFRSIRNPQTQAVQQRNYWEEWLTRYDGERWTPAVVMPNSAGRQSVISGIAAGPNGKLWLTWTTDNRTYGNPHKPIHHEVYAASIDMTGAVTEPKTGEPTSTIVTPIGKGKGKAASIASALPNPDPTTQNLKLGYHANELRDVNAIRDYRTTVGNAPHRIVRGDLHRHTEMSWDGGGGNDGSVLDFYRYMIDVAAMDYGAITDHNAGGDYEYWWWLIEKLADLHHAPGAYVPLFAYERSAVYPNGHRNIVHAYRGVPVVSFFTKPSLLGERPGVGTGELLDNDTKLLYNEIRRSKGIAIPHTSATRMGTDWRDNDKQLEPVVEIFQGARTNYEYAGAPKSADPERDAQHTRQAGYEKEGFVWNAWKRGYRLGTITSSDHGSTHMSYALVYTPNYTRDGIVDAIRKRHTYGATDNIILEFRIGSAFMGDEITVSQPPKLWFKVVGTNDLEKIEVVKNNEFIYSKEPIGRTAEVTFRDNRATRGTSYYYVRVQQKDGQVAWSSPIWVTLK